MENGDYIVKSGILTNLSLLTNLLNAKREQLLNPNQNEDQEQISIDFINNNPLKCYFLWKWNGAESVNDDDGVGVVWEQLGLSCCWDAAFSGSMEADPCSNFSVDDSFSIVIIWWWRKEERKEKAWKVCV